MIITLDDSILFGILSILFISSLAIPLGTAMRRPWTINILFQNPYDPLQKDEKECVRFGTQKEANEFFECKLSEGLPFDYNYGTFNLSRRQRRNGKMVTILLRQASIKNGKDGNPDLNYFPIVSAIELD
jgi:hypothetical protein